MHRCEKCGCTCDPGDLQGGICDDCRSKEQKQEENQETLLRMMRGGARQMELKDFEN